MRSKSTAAKSEHGYLFEIVKANIIALVIALIAILLVAVVLIPNVAAAEADGSFTQNTELADFVKELCACNNLGKEYARNFLAEKFTEALNGKGSVKEQVFTVGQEHYVNLVAQLTRPQASAQIIIGAHYDSVGDGAGDNACGVAALYLIMKTLASRLGELPYNIVFVAFDGEEDGLLGSRYYVEKMSQRAMESTVVMFNFDTIATGDNLYVHCENKPTDLAKLITDSVEGLQEKPYAKGIFGSLYDAYGYGYFETVQGSDHTPFRLAGIPTALFFSGTYSATVWGYAETSDPTKSVINTSRDTFENLVSMHPSFESRIVTVSDAVVNTIMSESFYSGIAGYARKQLVNLNFWYKAWWPIIAVVVIAIIITVFAFLYYRKLQKNAILGDSEIKTQKVFEKPSADDIFSFKSDDADDIFTFKK